MLNIYSVLKMPKYFVSIPNRSELGFVVHILFVVCIVVCIIIDCFVQEHVFCLMLSILGKIPADSLEKKNLIFPRKYSEMSKPVSLEK